MRSLRFRLLAALLILPVLVAGALTVTAIHLFQRDKVLYVSDTSAQTVDLLARNLATRLAGLVARARLGAQPRGALLRVSKSQASKTKPGAAAPHTSVRNVSKAGDARLRVRHRAPGGEVLVIEVRPRALLDLRGYSGAAELVVVNRAGELLVARDAAHVASRRSAPIVGALKLFAPRASRLGTRQLEVSGERSLVSYARVRPADVAVVQSVPLRLVRAAATPLITTAVLISGITVALAVIIGLVIGQRIIGPLRMMAEHAEAIARGEFGVEVKAQGAGDVGALIERLNRMSGALKERDDELRNMQGQLLQAERLNATARMINSIVEELSEPLDQCVSVASSARGVIAEGHPAHELQGDIIDHANRASNILQNLRRAAAPDDVASHEVEADLTLADTVMSAKSLLERRELDLHSDVAPDTTLFVRPDQLNNALLDMLLYVAQRAERGSTISILAGPADADDAGRARTRVAIRYRGEAPDTDPSTSAQSLPLAVASVVLREESGTLETGAVGDKHELAVLLLAKAPAA